MEQYLSEYPMKRQGEKTEGRSQRAEYVDNQAHERERAGRGHVYL